MAEVEDSAREKIAPPHVLFKTETHQYFLDQEIPSVSAVLGGTGLVDYSGVSKGVMENARQFGQDVDLACQLYDENDLDEDSLDESVRKRLNGWIKFRNEWEFKPQLIATPMSHILNGMAYGMTPDRVGVGKMGFCVVDIKNTADIEAHHSYQLAAYRQPFKNDKADLYIVQLFDDDFKLHDAVRIKGVDRKFTDVKNERIFACGLALTYEKMLLGLEWKGK